MSILCEKFNFCHDLGAVCGDHIRTDPKIVVNIAYFPEGSVKWGLYFKSSKLSVPLFLFLFHDSTDDDFHIVII